MYRVRVKDYKQSTMFHEYSFVNIQDSLRKYNSYYDMYRELYYFDGDDEYLIAKS